MTSYTQGVPVGWRGRGLQSGATALEIQRFPRLPGAGEGDGRGFFSLPLGSGDGVNVLWVRLLGQAHRWVRGSGNLASPTDRAAEAGSGPEGKRARGWGSK